MRVMRVACALGLAVLAMAGCSGPFSGTAGSSPAVIATQDPPSGRWAVMVHRAGVGEPYVVQLVSLDGRGGPFVQPVSRSLKQYWFPPSPCPQARCSEGETAAYTMPETSISRTRVYFLDGESTVRSLSPDGSVQTVMNLSAPDNSQVVFGVSPDDKRIVISVITLARTRVPASFDDVMYVEDLGTGANRVDLYSSTTVGEWPVGWHAGRLVVGVASADLFSFENPYGVVAYHIVDPATGARLGALDCARGLLVAAGTACASGWCTTGSTCGSGTLGKQAWDGTQTPFTVPSGPPPKIFTAFANAAELSPDGVNIATSAISDQPSFAVETLLFKNGSSSILTRLGSPLGWLDSSHVLVSSVSAVWIVDLNNVAAPTMMQGLQTIPQQGMPALSGILPANL
jgi:hypothetical protein